MNKELKLILDEIKKQALDKNKHPQEITKAEVLKSGVVSEWMLRKFGGFNSVRDANFPWSEKDLAEIKKLKDAKKYVGKLEKELGEKKVTEEAILGTIKESLKKLDIPKIKVKKFKPSKGRNMTLELMISDVHYGKKTETFDLNICRERMRELTDIFMKELSTYQKQFNIHRIIISLLGDIIESYTMHGIESSMSSEFPNSVQVKEAIESLFYDVVLPIAQTGIEIDIPAVTGNHDRVEHGRTMHLPGETNLTWIIYNALDLLIKQSGLKNVKMYIPKDSFVLLPIYNNNILFEHTDNVKAPTEAALEGLIQKRSQQLGKVIDFLRGGHWHKYLCFGRGRIIINESVPGQDSYARVLGYDSHSGQTINYYVDSDRPTCFYKSFPVYLR